MTLAPFDDRDGWIWLDGDFVPWREAKLHVLTHGLHYGTGVFEGVRCYDTELGPAVFRNADHVARLLKSADEPGLSTTEIIRRALKSAVKA